MTLTDPHLHVYFPWCFFEFVFFVPVFALWLLLYAVVFSVPSEFTFDFFEDFVTGVAGGFDKPRSHFLWAGVNLADSVEVFGVRNIAGNNEAGCCCLDALSLRWSVEVLENRSGSVGFFKVAVIDSDGYCLPGEYLGFRFSLRRRETAKRWVRFDL